MQSDQSPIMQAIASLPNRPTNKLHHLPSVGKGLPFFGHTLDVLKEPYRFPEKQRKVLGPVFHSRIFMQPQVTLCEAEAAQLLLMDKDQNFSNSKGWFRFAPIFDRGILLRDFSEHRIHRRPLQAAFKSALMNAYALQLNEMMRDTLLVWEKSKNLHFHPAIKSLLLDNAAEIFLGAELGEESDLLNKAFIDLIQGIIAIFRVNLPGFAWHQSQRGKRVLTTWLNEQFESRLTSNKTDFFTSLCKASQDPEHAMSKQEVIEHTLLLLFAAHDTTTSTLSAMFSLLSKHPQWQDKLREECQSLSGDSLEFADMAKLPQCEVVFKETLRLYPPIYMIPRRSIRAFEYGGYTIPANTEVNLHPALIHRNPAYWNNPDEFHPERWFDEAEYKKHPYQWIPFGAGAHKCLGFRFAEMQSKIFMFHFFRHYQMTTDPERKHQMELLPVPVPKDELPMEISRLSF